jgi:hypothetical protein
MIYSELTDPPPHPTQLSPGIPSDIYGMRAQEQRRHAVSVRLDHIRPEQVWLRIPSSAKILSRLVEDSNGYVKFVMFTIGGFC